MKNKGLRIAVSGTYGTGKTTTSYALSNLTGIKRTHAATMREILPIILPGKRLEDCNPFDLYELGIRRLTERVKHEASFRDGFISDGSALHEWVYGRSRIRVGINPNANCFFRSLNKIKLIPYAIPFKEFNDYYGKIVKAHTVKAYDVFVHLPVEFPIAKDGHRPVSEVFRKLSDDYLIESINELKIPIVVATGNIENRLDTLLKKFSFETQMSVEEAVRLAKQETQKQNQIEIEFNKKNKHG